MPCGRLDKKIKIINYYQMSKKPTALYFSLLIGLCLLFFSCASRPEAYQDIDSAVGRDDFNVAIESLKRGQAGRRPLYPVKNAISLFMDKGLLEHYAGNYADSSRDLQEAERLIQEAFTKSVTANLASYIANDNVKEYPGEDFEDIYINVFNALNYYNRGDIDGALVEIRKLTASSGKLDMLSRKYENTGNRAGRGAEETLRSFGLSVNDAMPGGRTVNFSNSALARYLSALFYLSGGDTDDARIEFDQVLAAFASNTKVYYHPIPQSIDDIKAVPPEKARLNIIGFTGLSPVKEEGFFPAFFLFTYSILCQPVLKLPQFVKRPSVISRIEVIVEGENEFNDAFYLELLEDMGAVIEETYNARFSQIFYKTFIRLLVKYASVDIAANVAREQSGDLAEYAALLGGKLAADASEGADIRMSRYMPDKAYIGGINLDPGTYNITVHFYSGSRIIAKDERKGVVVRLNSPNLIETISLK
jgi:hypothetical protein